MCLTFAVVIIARPSSSSVLSTIPQKSVSFILFTYYDGEYFYRKSSKFCSKNSENWCDNSEIFFKISEIYLKTFTESFSEFLTVFAFVK